MIVRHSDAFCSWLRAAAGAVALLAACGPMLASEALATEEPPHSAELDAMIVREAQRHGVPERLVRRVVMRESRYNPHARNHRYWGLMQISYPTARAMGFKGTPQELLNPLVNLTYAVPYLANAFIAAGKREDAAIRLYASGYYDTARHRGLLGAMRTADSAPAAGFHDEVQQVAAADPQPSYGIFGALLNPFDSTPAPAAAAYAATTPQDAGQDAAPQAAQDGAARAASAASTSPRMQGAGTKTATGRKDGAGDADMVADKAGRAEPPKKWMRDGGVTVLARGEQTTGHADNADASDDKGRRRSAARHSRKNTQFAALDAPASAQAYASDASVPVASSQSAIADAITPGAVDPATGRQTGYAAAPAGMQEATAAAAPVDAVEKRAAKKKVRRLAAKRRAVVAKADTPAAASAAAATEGADPAEASANLRP